MSTPEIERAVARFGEHRRQLIIDALRWLDGQPWRHGLDREEFLRALLERAVAKVNGPKVR